MLHIIPMCGIAYLICHSEEGKMMKIMKFLACTALLGVMGVSSGEILQQNLAQESENVALSNEFNGEAVAVNSQVNLQTHAKSGYLMDYSTNTPIYAYNETKHLPIASMCKIMTLLLAFEAIDSEIITIDEKLCVSERAASMGGSQVFLEANASYCVRDLIKSIVVCSANDSCVALAERIAGSENLFVEKMNDKAKELGANDTLFANCTGLPKEPQYSCARDVAIMLKNLLKHEEYYEFGKVWTDKFSHPEGRYTEITNTNKLVRFYDGCDGGKTGFTNEAGFCLAATAKRDNMRVISVVIGEESSDTRFKDVRTMFDYAFANYTAVPIIKKGEILTQAIEVLGGKEKTINVYPERDFYAFAKKGEGNNVSYELAYEKLKAPIAQDTAVGEVILYKDGVECDRIKILSAVAVQKANFFHRLQEIARGWNK